MDSSNKIDRRISTREETMAFLSAYIARKEEFNNVRRKKYAMQNVLLDLESQGVLSQPTTVEMLSAKLKNLVRAYKQSADNNSRTGATPCNAPFADLMEEIFGDNPGISNNHFINLYGQPLNNEIGSNAPTSSCPNTSSSTPSSSMENSDNLVTSVRKARSYRPALKEKIVEIRLKCKKELAANKLKSFEEYATKILEKMEQAKLLKQKRHEEKMAKMTAFLDAKKSKLTVIRNV